MPRHSGRDYDREVLWKAIPASAATVSARPWSSRATDALEKRRPREKPTTTAAAVTATKSGNEEPRKIAPPPKTTPNKSAPQIPMITFGWPGGLATVREPSCRRSEPLPGHDHDDEPGDGGHQSKADDEALGHSAPNQARGGKAADQRESEKGGEADRPEQRGRRSHQPTVVQGQTRTAVLGPVGQLSLRTHADPHALRRPR